jgi:hypothetical protein
MTPSDDAILIAASNIAAGLISGRDQLWVSTPQDPASRARLLAQCVSQVERMVEAHTSRDVDDEREWYDLLRT